MITKFIEVTNTDGNGEHRCNWGKFMFGSFTAEEWHRYSAVEPSRYLLPAVGWGDNILLVPDLQTGEGSSFPHGGYAKADLDRHEVWVCPMLEPFLTWLYEQDVGDLDASSSHVTFHFKDAPAAIGGYRRKGPSIID